MAARTVSELANWDGRRDQQRQNSKRRRSSSNLVRDPSHTPLQNKRVEVFKRPGQFSDRRRAEQSAFHSQLERDSLANTPANTRLSRRVDTTSTSLHDIHQGSIVHTAPNTALTLSPFIASPKSSHLTPNSSVHTSRIHSSQPSSSRERIPLSQHASTIESEVIDLTLEDTDDEKFVSDMLVPHLTNFNDQRVSAGPSRRNASSRNSSPIAPEQSLFTPPLPPRRRTRLFMDYLAVPSFPKGLTRADYRPMTDHSAVPLPAPPVTSTLRDSPLVESLVAEERTPPQKKKGKEREHDVVSSCKTHKQHPVNRTDVVPSALLDAFYEHTMIPLHDDDSYPPLTTFDLMTNTRFQFAHAWRGHASRLHEAELHWQSKFKLLGKACIWARSADTSSPRVPGTAGYVSSEHLRPWELVLPDSSPQEKSTGHLSDEYVHATESEAAAAVDANYLTYPDDALPGPSAAFDPTLSNSTVAQDLAVIDMEHDMNQYFTGLSDSPTKHIQPRQQLAPMHTFRPHLLQSAGHPQMDSLGLGFPSLEPHSRPVDTDVHECFLGVPPSSPPADMESSAAPGPISDSPFEFVNHFSASLGDIYETSPTDAWPFEQGEGILPNDDLPPDSHVAPTSLGTIDPSLLGPEQSQKLSEPPKHSTPKRRFKLPEPVIYIRRPIDSSSLPLLSGKRPVQIKYRDSGGSPASPSTQTGSNEAPSNLDRDPVERARNDTNDTPQGKRRLAPSRKLREYHDTFESESDCIPETSTSKIKIKLKRPSLKDKESVVERQGTGAETVPTMSFCHQCRNKSVRPKMLCTNVIQGRVCGKRFCNRCILYRYPDITFDEHSAGFLCPVCTNTCNCSFCSRNRGEEFISMRLGGLAASLFKSKVTFVRDVGKPLRRAQSPPDNADVRWNASATMTPTPEPSAQPMQSQFWAHVYGMNGERVGSAFMTREHMERLQARGPSPAVPLPPPKKARKPKKRNKEREKTRGPRVFVGHPLASWHVQAVCDLEPSLDAETAPAKENGKEEGTGTGTAITTGTRRRRCYIGNPSPLYEPYERMPATESPTPSSSRCSTQVLDSDGSLTPLSELEADYWPQPEVGECCSWAPPPPPGTIVHNHSSDSIGLSGPFVGKLPGPRPPSTTDTNTGSAVEVGIDVGIKQASSSTALSEQDLARAISVALAALSVTPP